MYLFSPFICFCGYRETGLYKSSDFFLDPFMYWVVIVLYISPILRIGDQVLTFDVFWPKHLQMVRSTVYIPVQSI